MSDNFRPTRPWREIALEAISSEDSPQLHLLLLELLEAIDHQVLKRPRPDPNLSNNEIN